MSLPNPRPGSIRIPRGWHARGHRRLGARGQELGDRCTEIEYVPVRACLGRSPRWVTTSPAPAAATGAAMLGVAQPGVIVDEVGAGVERRRGHRRAVGVDRDHGVGVRAQLRDHRHHPSGLDRRVELVAGLGGHPADVECARAAFEQRQPVRDSVGGGGGGTLVIERVRASR